MVVFPVGDGVRFICGWLMVVFRLFCEFAWGGV